MKTIEADFDSELIKAKFPYKELILSNALYKDSLFNEFKNLQTRPKQSIFIEEHLSITDLHSERAGNPSGSTGAVETCYYQLTNEFYELLSNGTLQEKYNGRDILHTSSVKALTEVGNKMRSFEKYVLENEEISSYNGYAKAVSSKIITLLNGFSFKNELLLILASSEKSKSVSVLFILNGGDINEIEERYGNLKVYFDGFINDELKNARSVHPAETKFESLKVKLTKYGFFTLPKVRQLHCVDRQDKLVELLASNDAPYQIAMFDYLNFLEFTKLNYAKKQTIQARNKLIAENIIGRHEDTVKNLINYLSRPDNKRYTAALHKNDVVNDFNNL
ncbi:hypothetical protein [Mucilaginibacter sp.]|uniref:hypothetical protein n=1 Tax=Mucilaginibacter sp. TaxID=1882438 RepID=UPI0025E2EA3B|nr:hypothetical protein [Mucilaginibacter sp.]